ncbi:luciferase family protein [Streptomyces sp. yr375]|uniref:luciferase domain-containing protein n=1 Tax=Streptomyces sp. yr375 TaxID=1761906 RepID=UPI000B86EC41|nr:luciferase family protein [Streptomyces sp. yr375]
MTAASRALARLATWPDLAEDRPSCGTGRAVRSGGVEIVHFHSDVSVDLHLTAKAIRRYERDLRHSTAIRLLPGSPWVTVHLECETDIDLLMTLVSAALQAHQQNPAAADAPLPRCNDHREVALSRETG